jgi:ribosomal protein L16/L10AE
MRAEPLGCVQKENCREGRERRTFVRMANSRDEKMIPSDSGHERGYLEETACAWLKAHRSRQKISSRQIDAARRAAHTMKAIGNL